MIAEHVPVSAKVFAILPDAQVCRMPLVRYALPLDPQVMAKLLDHPTTAISFETGLARRCFFDITEQISERKWGRRHDDRRPRLPLAPRFGGGETGEQTWYFPERNAVLRTTRIAIWCEP